MTDARTEKTFFVVAIPFFAAAAAAAASGSLFPADGPWYQSLTAPAFRPPSWIFGPVWTVLYVLIALAGARLARHLGGPRGGLAVGLWSLQMVLNALWTPAFFGAHDLFAALVVVLLLGATIAVLIALSWRLERLAALLLLPYLGWVTFAAILNAAYWWLNP
ncbi:MAG: tryptophan-rich sensory protein [Verrucomicrobia bacterium]|nr:MAG: tryptophan-rich sensory protein [Verrucomicrobiota bacterium]